MPLFAVGSKRAHWIPGKRWREGRQSKFNKRFIVVLPKLYVVFYSNIWNIVFVNKYWLLSVQRVLLVSMVSQDPPAHLVVL